MLMENYINRDLTIISGEEEERINDTELLNLDQNIVILGEAGMGKTELLRYLARNNNVKLIQARSFVAAIDPKGVIEGKSCILLDAIDESPNYREGDAIDSLFAKLDVAGRPRFILTCRAEDWKGATTKSILTDLYGQPPIEMRLRPFDTEQIKGFLSLRLGNEIAEKVYKHYHDRGFRDWLGNAQTLTMIAEVCAERDPPNGTSELFSQFADLTWSETNRARQEQRSPRPKESVLDTLGALFAATIIGGKDGFTLNETDPSGNLVPIAELSELPGFAEQGMIRGSRLIAELPNVPGGLSYVHRRVGEWLAARWLDRQAGNNPEKVDRLISNLVSEGIVPANLRGLFGWLANYDRFAKRVILTDPVAVIEYGDADALGQNQASLLLDALEQLAERNPWFSGYGEHRARSLVKGSSRQLVIDRLSDEDCPFHLRALLAEQFEGEMLSADEVAHFRSIVLDQNTEYYLRRLLATALAPNLNAAEQRELSAEVLQLGSRDDARLASVIAVTSGLEIFEISHLAEVIMAAAGYGARGEKATGDYLGMLIKFKGKTPDNLLENLLNELSELAEQRLPKERGLETAEIIDLGEWMIDRRINLGPVDPSKLLKWLHAFRGRQGYSEEVVGRIAAFLQNNDEIRQAVQREFLNQPEDLQRKSAQIFRLPRIQPGLTISDADFVAYLSTLPVGFPDWEIIAHAIRHSETEGLEARRQLKRITGDTKEYREWEHNVLHPKKPGWLIEDEQRDAQREKERQDNWQGFKEELAQNKEEMRAGQYGPLEQAANVYFGEYSDIRHLTSLEDRLNSLIDSSIIGAFYEGLDAWLNKLPPWPNAHQLSIDHADNRSWRSRYVLLAAMAEHLKRVGNFIGVETDHIFAAQLHIDFHAIDEEEWHELRSAIWSHIISDDQLFRDYARLACERSMENGRQSIGGLYRLIHETADGQLQIVKELAEEWLEKYPAMDWRVEGELLDLLLASGRHNKLRELVDDRLTLPTLDENNRRNWQAIGLAVKFDTYKEILAGKLLDNRELFWILRDRLGINRYRNDRYSDMAVNLAGWLVANARSLFPVVERPNTVTTGDTNPWDASQVIGQLISYIGANQSDDAGDILVQLATVNDGYRNMILSVLDEHRQKRAETRWESVSPQGLKNILTAGRPVSMPDLQFEVIRLLDMAQKKITRNDTDVWMGFYETDQSTPKKEEYCSNALIEILRGLTEQIEFEPEKHLANEREGDIACRVGKLNLPVEVKCQWHKHLWIAADTQLTEQAKDHESHGYGILLALWFGPKSGTKKLYSPPNTLDIDIPQSATDLENGLIKASKLASTGRIRIKVIDLSRDQPKQKI